MSTTSPYTDPKLVCDVVMKGGITSGVVYPGAVLPLAKRYRFKSIGGASAGGIAAAIVAAAEHARDAGGFDELATLPQELSGRGNDGRPFMLQLFQPDPATRSLFTVLIGFLERGLRGGLWNLLGVFWLFPLIGLGVGVGSILITIFAGVDAVVALAGACLGGAIAFGGVGLQAWKAVARVPANHFGLCRLGPQPAAGQAPALTEWLHGRIQATSNRESGDPPLSFADLWAGSDVLLPPIGPERLTRLLELSRDFSRRAVDLQMVTTDLTHGLPMRLPSPYQRQKPILEQGGGLLFDPDELRAFFPEDVVDHLVTFAPCTDAKTAARLDVLGASGLRRFPIGPDLPVVVATRMTLSFPMLISAIPLWELDYRQSHEPTLQRVYFSDGGISSNFPVHFFDSPLPAHPTFGLDLIGFEPGEGPDEHDPCRAVRQPGEVSAPAYRSVTEITGLVGFLTAIKDAMQNWRDNAQSQLPGFRDRVARIRLDKGEGGLNLTMKSGKIMELNDRGRCAGESLVELFAGDGERRPQHWNDHRFVRYRTSMSLLERLLRDYDRGYRSPPDLATRSYPERVAEGTSGHYAFTERDLEFAQATTLEYLALVEEWNEKGETLDGPGVPRPPSILRAIPPV
jgi:predicted acylesterase/phospholipase RssA